MNLASRKIGILWAQYGPYHFARFSAFQKLIHPAKLHAIEMANRTSWYEWNRGPAAVQVTALCPDGVAESLPFAKVFRQARKTFSDLKLDACFLPGYAPKESLAALLAAKSLGIRTIMMNESHAGTARSRGLKTLLKRSFVGMFDTALLGGQPQKRYYTSLGMRQDRIFLGYDAVDNDYFAIHAAQARANAVELRKQYRLPERYFLSLGRFIQKKNLPALISAFHRSIHPGHELQPHLVMVGSGEEEEALRALCQKLQLPVYNKAPDKKDPVMDESRPGVHFYGFRQVEENPVFYALAETFILPSLYEEWGLVVNEAMASGLPVIVTETAGCAEDLLEPFPPGSPIPAHLEPILATVKNRTHIRRNGFVFDPQSVEELSDYLKLFAANPTLREVMGAASSELVERCSCRNFAENASRAAEAAIAV